MMRAMDSRPVVRASVILSAWLLLAYACGGGSNRQAVSRACDLLSQDDASRVLGAPVEAAEELPGTADSKRCSYAAVAQPAGYGPGQAIPTTYISVGYVTGSKAVSFFRTFKQTPPPSVAVDAVSGVGDDALWDGQEVLAVAGHDRVEVKAQVAGTPNRDRSVETARLVVQHLKQSR